MCNNKLEVTLNRYNSIIGCKNVNKLSHNYTSRKQLKKYAKICRSAFTKDRLVRKYRVSVNTLRQSNLRLKDDLICNNELLMNTIKSYEEEANIFQEKILLLECQLEKISQDYEVAQVEMSDQTTAMGHLVDMCLENEERFNSLINNYTCNHCLDSQPSQNHSSDDTCSNKTVTATLLNPFLLSYIL